MPNSTQVMDCHCETIDEFWETIRPENPFLNSPQGYIFRGQGNADWKLIPSVQRENSQANKLLNREAKLSIDQIGAEFELINLFCKGCDFSGLAIPGDSLKFRTQVLQLGVTTRRVTLGAPWPHEEHLELLALAQHHGVHTRMLDWSRFSIVAAYFASIQAIREWQQNGNPERRMAVWIFDLKFKHFVDQKTWIIEPPRSISKNLPAQQGWLTAIKEPIVDGGPYQVRPFEQVIESEVPISSPPALMKVSLPITCARKVMQRCDSYGINAATIFPRYDGAAQYAAEHATLYNLLVSHGWD